MEIKQIMESLFIGAPELTQEGEYTTLSAPVRVGGTEMRLWFRVPASVNPALSVNPFLATCLVPAMALGKPIEVESQVSAKLLHAIDSVQDIYHSWYPELKHVSVSAEPLPNPREHRGGVGCFFTGGVDSLYTFLKHEQEITTVVYVHGFDVGLNDDPLRKKVSDALHEFAVRTGKSLIEVESNLRDFTNHHGNWGERIHGPALASVGMVLDTLLERIYIPSSYNYSELFPWGSHPLVDYLWSTETLQVVHDGCEASRFEKVAAIANDDRALSTLRVCYENRNGDYNCGVCEKCLRTMTSLEILGAMNRCPTFSASFNLETIRQFELTSHGAELFWNDNYKAAVEHQRVDIAAALRNAIDQYDISKIINSLSDRLAGIVNSPRWNNFTRRHRERLLLSLLKGSRGWVTKEVIKENIKHVIGVDPKK